MLWLIVIALIFFFVDWRLGAFLTALAVIGYIMTVAQQGRGVIVRGKRASDWGTPSDPDVQAQEERKLNEDR